MSSSTSREFFFDAKGEKREKKNIINCRWFRTCASNLTHLHPRSTGSKLIFIARTEEREREREREKRIVRIKSNQFPILEPTLYSRTCMRSSTHPGTPWCVRSDCESWITRTTSPPLIDIFHFLLHLPWKSVFFFSFFFFLHIYRKDRDPYECSLPDTRSRVWEFRRKKGGKYGVRFYTRCKFYISFFFSTYSDCTGVCSL